MKIVLTTLPREGEFINWTTSEKLTPPKVKYIPLGLLSLATNITGNHEIIIVDPLLYDWSIEETINKIHSLEPDILGITAVTRKTYALYELLKKLKVKYIAVGGPHTTYYSNDILTRGADAVFIGNLADIEFNDAINSSELPKGIINCNTDVNKILYPNRKLINIQDYIYNGKVLFKAQNRLPMFSSLGCPRNCTFCNVQSKHSIYKDAKIVVQEMQELKSLGCGSVHIFDDNFNSSKLHLNNIIQELEKINWDMEWSARGQVGVNNETAFRLSNLQLKRFHVGIESLNDNVLKSFRKNQTTEKIKDFCKIMHENNIDLLAYFIVGSPLETKEYRETLTDKVRELNIKYPFFNVLFPEPNTEYYRSLIQDGFYKYDIWAEYMKNPTPNFEIPYPYGEDKKLEISEYNKKIIDEFK